MISTHLFSKDNNVEIKVIALVAKTVETIPPKFPLISVLAEKAFLC